MQETYTDMNTNTLNTTSDTLDEPAIIPFADDLGEASQNDDAVSTDDLGELALEEFGDSLKSESIVDRDLGLGNEEQQSTEGRYACPCCGDGATRVMRVRIISQPRWVALCAVCAASMLVRIPGTIVGGMVRPTRRKRVSRVRVAQQGQPRFQSRFGPRVDTRYRRAG